MQDKDLLELAKFSCNVSQVLFCEMNLNFNEKSETAISSLSVELPI